MIYRVVLDDTIDLHTSDINCMLLNPSLDLEMNSAGSFNFTLPPSHPYWDAIKVLKSTIDVYEDGDLIFTGRIASIEKNWNNERVVQCEGALAYFNDSVHRQMKWETPLPIASEDPTVHNFLKDILDNHNVFEGAENANRHIFIGNITVDPEVVTREVDYDTTLDILTRMCIDTNGGYMSVRKDLDDGKLYLDWIKDFTEESGQPAQFGLNLLNFDTSLAAEDICTGVLARGAEVNEQTVMLNNVELVDETTYPDMSVTHYTDKYQDVLWHREGVEKFGQVVQVHDFSDAQTAWKDGQGQIVANSLFEMAKKWLEEKNTKIETIEVEVAELAWLGEGMPKYKLGQIVELSDNVHMAGESYETRLLPMYKLSCDLNSGSKKVTLGTPPKKELTQISASNSDSSTLSSSGSSSGSGGSGEGEECRVHDVKVNGTSVVTDKIANVQVPTDTVTASQMAQAINTAVSPKANTADVNQALAQKQDNLVFNSQDAATAHLTKIKNGNDVYDIPTGTEVEANPTGTATSDLTKLKVGNDIYGIPSGGTTVVANPSETATDDLETIKIGNTVYDIPGSGGSTNYGKFKCDVLFVNDPLPSPTSGTTNVTRTYTLNKSIDDYDAVYVVMYGYCYSSQGATNILSRIVFKNDYYLKGFDNLSYYDGIVDPNRMRRINFTFTDSTHIQTMAFRSEDAVEPMLCKVYGLKFENKLINRSDIYSEEERMIGRWTDGKPLYQKTYDFGSAITINADSWYNTGISSGDIERIIEVSNGQAQTANTWPLGSAIDSGTIRLLNERNNIITLRWFTIQYTKTTDTPDSGVIPEDPMFISDPMIFSEEEQVVGSWTDGKPIYQKTFLNVAVQSGTSNIFTHNLGIDKYIDFSGRCCANGDGWGNAKPFPYYQINWSGYIDILGWDTNSITFNSKWNSSYVDITIQYTKVADSPLSGPKKGKIVQRSDIYSEEERLVGRWTDGKPLYQKTVVIDNPVSTGATTSIAHGIADVESIVDIYGGAYLGQTCIDLNSFGSSNYYTLIYASQTKISYELKWGSSTFTKIRATIQYTKTTDAPFSKQLIEDPQMVMMSDYYSEDEQVVGRWTDGKPIYQKTWDLGDNTAISNTSWTLINSIPNTNMDQVIEALASYSDGVSWSIIADATTNPCGFLASRANGGIQVRYITLRYTKTTDAPGTGPTKGNLIYLPALYSEEEREVGVWTDGKPIYQKNIPIPAIQSAQSGVLISNLGLNIDNCIDIKVRLYKDTTPDNDTVIATAGFGSMYFYYRKSEDSIRIDMPFSWVVGRYGNLTIQYTKITDQPGSGTWTPEGQLAHHYSTSEKIVGTWIDGSTIYERTWDFGSNIQIPSNTWYNTSIDSTNMDQLVDVVGYADEGAKWAMSGGCDGNVVELIQFRNNNIAVRYLTLQYTKSS